jgi:tripartite-type tricarboxylate transporter receptor subunit TctC
VNFSIFSMFLHLAFRHRFRPHASLPPFITMEASMLNTKIGALLACVSVWAGTACAQDWPSRPITMVVPFAAGGTTDLLGRVMAQHVGEILGQHVVVENIGGAGGMTGSLRVAQAPPDGSQVLFSGLGPLILSQTLYKSPRYNTVTDFVPVALVAEVPLVLVVRKDLPANSLQEFIAYAKANQATMTFGSAGSGSAPHMGCVLLNMVMGTQITHVPYRGSGPALQELIAGRIDFYCDAVSAPLPHIHANTMKAMAILSRKRAAMLPNLPTAQEQGLADFDAATWFGFFLPRGTPQSIVRRLHEATVKAMQAPAVRERMDKLGANLVAVDRTTPGYLSSFVRSELEKWAVPIKASGVSAD